MTLKAAHLSDRGVVRVGGEDATSFLQGLLTNDVERLRSGEARYAALLTPQGKILFDMLVVRISAEKGAAYLLDCAAAQAADLAKRLGFYKLRAKVAIADESAELGVVAAWNGAPDNAPAGIVYPDPRDPRLGWRAILPRARAVALGEADENQYETIRIGAGAPKGGVDFAYGDAFPHDANLDLINGVDFEKGCYVGQEVVSRIEHRANARSRLVPVAFDEFAPSSGPVMAGEREVGMLFSTSKGRGIAMLRLDRVADAVAAGTSLTRGNIPLHIVKPDWAGFTVPCEPKA